MGVFSSSFVSCPSLESYAMWTSLNSGVPQNHGVNMIIQMCTNQLTIVWLENVKPESESITWSWFIEVGLLTPGKLCFQMTFECQHPVDHETSWLVSKALSLPKSSPGYKSGLCGNYMANRNGDETIWRDKPGFGWIWFHRLIMNKINWGFMLCLNWTCKWLLFLNY